MSKKLFAVMALTLGVLRASVAPAATIVFQQDALLPGGGAYTGTEDTEIQGANPDLSFGSDGHVRADALDGGAEVQALLLFGNLFGSLPDQIPFGSTITSAVLTLSITNLSSSPAGNISVYEMTTAWSESSTWNSLGSGIQVGSETVASADDTHTVTALGDTTFNVLPSLQDWLGGGTNFGWVILNDSTDGVQFISSENLSLTQHPMLTVVFTPVPEPGSLVLAGLAGAAVLCVRHSRSRR